MAMNENELVSLQATRQIRNIGKTSLILLEESHNYIKSLEKLLIQMGITKYEESNFNYYKDRKKILDKVGDSERELLTLLNSFDIKFKR